MALWTTEQLTGINLWLDSADTNTLTFLGGVLSGLTTGGV